MPPVPANLSRSVEENSLRYLRKLSGRFLTCFVTFFPVSEAFESLSLSCLHALDVLRGQITSPRCLMKVNESG